MLITLVILATVELTITVVGAIYALRVHRLVIKLGAVLDKLQGHPMLAPFIGNGDTKARSAGAVVDGLLDRLSGKS
jgi:hypothetical protein